MPTGSGCEINLGDERLEEAKVFKYLGLVLEQGELENLLLWPLGGSCQSYR